MRPERAEDDGMIGFALHLPDPISARRQRVVVVVYRLGWVILALVGILLLRELLA